MSNPLLALALSAALLVPSLPASAGTSDLADELRYATALANRFEVKTHACMAAPSQRVCGEAVETLSRYSAQRDTLPIDDLLDDPYRQGREVTRAFIQWNEADLILADVLKTFSAWRRANR